jgi:hypothetical protein
MFRATRALQLSKQVKRTIVRDPRKNKAALSQLKVREDETSPLVSNQEQPEQQHHPIHNPNPMAPPQQVRQSFGSTMGTYVLYGAGITLGFTLVRLVVGV